MDPQKPSGSGIPILVVQIVLPMLLAIVTGYGAVKFTEGETLQKIQALDKRIEENRMQIETVRTGSVSREEMRLFIEQARQDLADIKSDIRSMRASERGR